MEKIHLCPMFFLLLVLSGKKYSISFYALIFIFKSNFQNPPLFKKTKQNMSGIPSMWYIPWIDGHKVERYIKSRFICLPSPLPNMFDFKSALDLYFIFQIKISIYIFQFKNVTAFNLMHITLEFLFVVCIHVSIYINLFCILQGIILVLSGPAIQ